MPATPRRCSLLGEPAGPPPCGIHAGCAPAQLGALGSRFTGCACLTECNGAGRADAQYGRLILGYPGFGFLCYPKAFGCGVGEASVPEEVLPASSSLAPTFSFSCVSSSPLLHPREEQGRPFWVRGPEGRGPAVTCFEITTTACQVLGEGRAGQGRAGQAALGCQSGLQRAYCLALQAPSFPILHLHLLPEVNR